MCSAVRGVYYFGDFQPGNIYSGVLIVAGLHTCSSANPQP